MATDPKQYLTTQELSQRPGAPSVYTLWEWRRRGKGPPYVRRDGRIFYRIKDVMAWEDGNIVYPTQAVAG
jgi:hypothetical protein